MRKRKLGPILALLSLAISNFFADGYLVSHAFSQSSDLAQNISTFGMVSYLTSNASLIIRRQIYQNWRFSPELRAATSDLWIGHWDAVNEAVQTKEIRPDFLAFLYVNIRERFPNGTNDPPGTFDTFMQNGWFLKDQYGTYIRSTDYGSYIVDVGNTAVQEWYANWIKGIIDANGLDGCQLDNCLPSSEIMWNTQPSGPINPRTGNVWTDQEFNSAVIAFVNKIKDTIGSKTVLGNGVWNGVRFWDSRQQWFTNLLLNSKIDGIISEGWMGDYEMTDWYNEATWLDSINLAVWVQDNILAKRKQGVFFPICASAGLPEEPLPDGSYRAALPPGVAEEQYVTFCFASLLLAASANGNYMNFGNYLPQSYPQSLFEVDVGTPLGAYQMVNGTHVYVRDFSNVKVLVNPTYDSYSVNLDANYETLNGTNLVSPITVAPHTGIILRRLSGP